MCYSSRIPPKPELLLKSVIWTNVGSTAIIIQWQTPYFSGEESHCVPSAHEGTRVALRLSKDCINLETDAAVPSGMSPAHQKQMPAGQCHQLAGDPHLRRRLVSLDINTYSSYLRHLAFFFYFFGGGGWGATYIALKLFTAVGLLFQRHSECVSLQIFVFQ